jgi:hypothetical protein
MIGLDVSSLRHLSIVMVQPGQDRSGNHPGSFVRWGTRGYRGVRDLLPNALMGSCLVEIRDVGSEDALELLLLQDEQVVQAFLPYTPHEPLTDGIRSWGMNRRFEKLDATCDRHASKTGSKLAVVITK